MCLNPKTIRQEMPDGTMVVRSVPCGHCIACLQDYQNSWKIRLSEEFSETCKGAFLTLTYEPATAPLAFDHDTGELVECDEFQDYIEKTRDNRVLSLQHTDFVNWIKRCREALCRAKGKRVKFKYFLCGEYGPRTLRPHGHCFLLGLDYKDVLTFFVQDWQKNFGYVYSSKVVYDPSSNKSPQRVANYVSKYCSKGEFENPRVAAGYVEKPKRLMSKGIGKHYAEKFQKFLFPEGFEDDYITYSDAPELLFVYFGPAPKAVFDEHGERVSRVAEKRYSEFVSIDFLDKIIDNLKCIYSDDETGKTFIYKMPRYIRSKVVPPGSSLAKQLENRVQDRIVSDRLEQLAQIQASHPTWTTMQATSEMVFQDLRKRQRRLEKSRQALMSFYGKSHF